MLLSVRPLGRLLLEKTCFNHNLLRRWCSKPALSPIYKYSEMLKNGVLKPDLHQFRAINQLQEVFLSLKSYAPAIESLRNTGVSLEGQSIASLQPVKGLYLYGNVGSGKTLLLDLLYDCFPTPYKKRIHFNAFMLFLYSQVNKWNLCHTDSDFPDVELITPTEFIANTIFKDAWLLCFDEIQLADYASCSLLEGIFKHLLRKGVVIIGTSNRAPSQLGDTAISDQFDADVENVKDTMRSFKRLLEEHCKLFHLNSERDHRLEMKPGQRRYLYPVSRDNEEALDRMFHENIAPHFQISSAVVTVYGRNVVVPVCSHRVARFSFSELCERPLGPADYISICNAYSKIFIENIPKMGIVHKNEARRFLSFIDAAYESRVQVFCTAQECPESLFQMLPRDVEAGDDLEQMQFEMIGGIAYDLKLHGLDFRSLCFISGEDEIFSFRRAISRIKEMQSSFYQMTPHRPQAFLPYVGSGVERMNAADNRKLRERKRQERIQKLKEEAEAGSKADASSVVEPTGYDHVERMRKETDWGDEASYIGWSQEIARKQQADQKQRDLSQRQVNAPTFGDHHFWGFGWWEHLVGRIRKRPKRDE